MRRLRTRSDTGNTPGRHFGFPAVEIGRRARPRNETSARLGPKPSISHRWGVGPTTPGDPRGWRYRPCGRRRGDPSRTGIRPWTTNLKWLAGSPSSKSTCSSSQVSRRAIPASVGTGPGERASSSSHSRSLRSAAMTSGAGTVTGPGETRQCGRAPGSQCLPAMKLGSARFGEDSNRIVRRDSNPSAVAGPET